VWAKERLRQLRLKASYAHAVIPEFADRLAANTARGDAERRLQRLLAPRAENGFNMREDYAEVVQARQELEKLTADAQRLSALHEAKSVAFQSVSRVVQAIEDWPKRGRPHGTALQDCDGPEPKPLKGETVTDAVETPAPTRSRAAGRRPSHLQFLLPKFLLQAAHACDGRATGAARRA